MVYVNTVNYVYVRDNEDFSEVVAISPFPGVFGYVEVYSIPFYATLYNPIETIAIPLNLPLQIGNNTITLNKLLVTDIYVSSRDSSGKIAIFYSNPQNIRASLVFYGQGELHGTYFFEGTIYVVVQQTKYPADFYLNIFGLYYIGHELTLYK
jgi:hypothetical protein